MTEENAFDIEGVREYIRAQGEYIEKVRSIKHDMAAHLLVVKYYLADAKYENAAAYIEHLLGENERVQWDTPELGNGLVDSVVFGCLKKSRAAIDFRCNGMIPDDLHMQDADLCTLFSNVLSNAVEACEHLKTEPKCIVLKLRRENSDWYVEAENPIEWEIPENLLGSGTTKADAEYHGYGIRNIKSVVEKYQGSVHFAAEDGKFRVEIVLRDVVK